MRPLLETEEEESHDQSLLLDEVRDKLEVVSREVNREDFQNSFWKFPLSALGSALKLLERLQRLKFIRFLQDALKEKKPRKESIAFINTLAAWIRLSNGQNSVSSDNEEHASFKTRQGYIYSDVTLVCTVYPN
jgi:hypothetical protein